MEKSLKMQQSGEGIELIRPSGKKWEQIWSDGEFSYVFFRTFLCIYQKWWPQLILALKLTKFFWWLMRYRHSHMHLNRRQWAFWCILGHPNADQPFGGLTILLAGDLRQLPPIGDLPMFSESGGDMSQCLGRALYRMFDKNSFSLISQMRQQGDENAGFRSELERLATGEFSVEDWRHWQKPMTQWM